MDGEDTLFLLYTSGSTGKPKGIAHTTAGYLLGVAMTMKYVFDFGPQLPVARAGYTPSSTPKGGAGPLQS